MKNPWVVVSVITVLLFGGAILLSSKSIENSNKGVEIIQHTKGEENAVVKLVEYSDFQCPACGAFNPVVGAVLDQYGDKISFEYKHFPLSTIHPNALPASIAAEAAGQQGKFFEFHDMLFEKQNDWSSTNSANSFFISYAQELGLDLDQFKRQMKSSVLRDKVRGEFEEGRQLGITGTPTFFLNGNRMEFETYEAFTDQIAAAVDPSAVLEVEPDQRTEGSGVKFGI